MFRTYVYEFENGKWVPTMEGFLAECGHWHWHELKPIRRIPRYLLTRPINYPVQASLADISYRRKP